MVIYKTSADDFWTWFIHHEASFRNDIHQLKYEEVNTQLKEKLQDVLPEVVFEITKKDNSYIVELMPMGHNINRVMMLSLILFMPKSLKHWKFYNYRIGKKGVLQISDKTFKSEDIMIFPIYDKNKNRIKLKVKEQIFKEYSDEEKFSIFYLMLYENIGEIITESLIEQVEFITDFSFKIRYKHHTQMPLSELREWIELQIGKKEMNQAESNGLIYEYFSGKADPRNKEPRFDILKGYSALMEINHEYYEIEKPVLHYLKEQGIQAIYLYIDKVDDPIWNQIQRFLKHLLHEHGFILGVSEALAGYYIDLVLFDDKDIEDAWKKEYPNIELSLRTFL